MLAKYGTGQITGTSDADGEETPIQRTASAYTEDEWAAVVNEEPTEGE